MKTMLFLTNSDLGLGAGNTVLIARRAVGFYNQHNIKTHCFINLKKHHSIDKLNYEGVDFAFFDNKNDLGRIIKQLNPDYICFYGVKILKFYNYIRRVTKKAQITTKIFYDMQACLEEKYEYSRNKIRSYLQLRVQRFIFRTIINKIDGCFVVTDELEDYCKSFLRKNSRVSFFHIRCGVVDLLDSNNLVKQRQEYREKLNIDKDTTVFVYSGFRYGWQKINDIIEHCKVYDNYMEKTFFCFFCNNDESFETQLRDSFPKGNYLVSFLSNDDYFKYLSACDVGFLIRDKNVTNKVAFPNKFSDYVNAGLMIVIDDALPEPYRLLLEYGIDSVSTELRLIDKNAKVIKSRSRDIESFYQKTRRLCKNELVYESQVNKIEL